MGEENKTNKKKTSNKKEVVITYDTLFDTLIRERNNEDLQKLPDNFFKEIVDYLKEKKKLVENNQEVQTDLFGQYHAILKQITNTKKIIRDIYEKREKKITEMALNQSRIGKDRVETDNLTKTEKAFFQELAQIFDYFRKEVLFTILNEKEPEPEEIIREKNSFRSRKTEEFNEVVKGEEREQSGREGEIKGSGRAKEKEQKEKTKGERKTRTIRFLVAVPKFAGEDLEEYGPFEEEDIACLPEKMAELLIESQRAEEIKEKA